jgi:hypothetical protein
MDLWCASNLPPITNAILLIKYGAVWAQEGMLVSILADVPNLTSSLDISINPIIQIFALEACLWHWGEGRVIPSGNTFAFVFTYLIGGWLLCGIRCLKGLRALPFCDNTTSSAVTDIDVVFLWITSLFNWVTIWAKLMNQLKEGLMSNRDLIEWIIDYSFAFVVLFIICGLIQFFVSSGHEFRLIFSGRGLSRCDSIDWGPGDETVQTIHRRPKTFG